MSHSLPHDSAPSQCAPVSATSWTHSEICLEGEKDTLQHCRNTIDNLDRALLSILAERFRCTEQIGHYKARHHLPEHDEERQKEQLLQWKRIAQSSGLPVHIAESTYHCLVSHVQERHKMIKDMHRDKH